MAEILEVNQMIAPAFEPKRQNRWIVVWDGIDTYTLRNFARPNLNMGEVVIDYINTKRYFTGKFEWQTISMTLNDPIAPSQAQKMMEWVRLAYENVTGRAGYKEMYTAKNFRLKLLDPPGSVVEEWEFVNIWPQSVDFQGLDMASAEVAQIAVTLRFDQALMRY